MNRDSTQSALHQTLGLTPHKGSDGTPQFWVRTAIRSSRRACGPHLGVFYQYPPRPLYLPPSYAAARPCSDAPVISVVTPSYQQGRFLERTLLSVLDQPYPALQYVVQDGASTDNTAAILDRYRDRLLHIESVRDRGQGNAINLGFRHTTGEIMAYLNSDDLLLPGSLSYVGNFFAAHPDVDVIYGHRIIIDEDDQEVGRWIVPPHHDSAVIWNDYVPQETLFWRRRVWEKAGGGISEELHSALDWDMLLRFHRAGAVFRRLPRFLGAFRVHAQQKTQARHEDLGLPEARLLRDRFHGRSISRLEAAIRVAPYLFKHLICHRLYQFGIFAY